MNLFGSDIEKKRAEKLSQAKLILKSLGMPDKQSNDRSGWVFLALANITPNDNWSSVTAPLLPTVDIMQFIREHYGMDYKPNSRETIRRQTLHQFEQGRIVDRNRDNPKRPTNSKNNNYSLNQPILNILKSFPTGSWQDQIDVWTSELGTLKEKYAQARDLVKIPIKMPDGNEIHLTPGKHNKLHADIIHEFCARFIGESGMVLYIGDTGSSGSSGGKMMIYEAEILDKLGIPEMSHAKLPDIVVYDKKNHWLFLIEAVTSHGPVSPKRWEELQQMLSNSSCDPIYVTAFPDKNTFKKYVADVAWETEVWIADNPDHMVHFNGHKFFGPYKE